MLQRILIIQPLNLAGQIDAVNTLSTGRVADGTNFKVNRLCKFVKRTEVTHLDSVEDMPHAEQGRVGFPVFGYTLPDRRSIHH